MKEELNYLVQLLLLKNKKNVDKAELKLQIQSHPSYPSLHAITGVLDHFGVENMALDIPQNKDVYKQLPSFFIAQIEINDSKQIVFVEKKDTKVIIHFTDKKKKKMSISNFISCWTGIIVVIDEEEFATKSISKNKLINYIPITLLVFTFGFLLVNYPSTNIFSALHLTLSAIGIYISLLLVKHELGINSEVVDKLCTQSERTSCDAVLNSKGAKVFGIFKLSDISLIYFSSLLVIWSIIFISKSSVLNLMTLISIITLPVVLFSIYYQAIIVKKWCPLCLATAFVLVSQSVLSYLLKPFNFSFELNGFLIIIFSFMSIISLYSYIKPIIKNNLSLNKTKIEFFKFKRKFAIFNSIYSNNPYLNTSINNINELVFGNINANIEIVVITNPLCGFCKATHQAIEKLLNTMSSNIKVIIRFNINTANKEDISYKIATILLNLYQYNKEICKKALHEIYTDNVDINQWLEIYKNVTKGSQFNTLESEKKWCAANNINFTPAVYLNNKKYPKEYDLTDVSFFIEDLIENYKDTNIEKVV